MKKLTAFLMSVLLVCGLAACGSSFSGTVNAISEMQPDAIVSDNTLSLSRNDVTASEETVTAWAEGLGLK